MTTSRLVPEQMIIQGISLARLRLVVIVGCIAGNTPNRVCTLLDPGTGYQLSWRNA